MNDDLLIPQGGVLLHIGPYKTGSTAIQKAMARRRDDLVAHGVLYPGRGHRQDRAGWGLLGRAPRGRDAPREEDWLRLVEQVAAAGGVRTCISSEDFCSAGPEQVSRIVSDLGADRLQVVAVARRLDRLLPSQWQQRVKTSHETTTYDEWLRQVLGEDRTGRIARQFWNAHSLGSLIGRWVPPLPPERFAVVIGDDSDRNLLPRTFERLLGLPRGFLVPEPGTNTSLSMDRVELLRRLNVAFDQNGWSDAHHLHLVRRGVLRGLEQEPPGPGESRVPPVPAWAADRVAELSEARARSVEELGVRVVGDARDLRTVSAVGGELPSAPGSVAMDAALAALTGMVRGALAREDRLETRRHPPGRTVDQTPARDLAGEVLRRGLGRARRRLRRDTAR